MIKWTVGNRHQQIFWWQFSFNETFCPGRTSGGHHSKPLKVDKLTRGLSFSGLPFPFHKRKLQRISLFRTWMMYWKRPKSGCSASESLLWVLILDLKQPKKYFSWRVTWKGDGQLDTSWYSMTSWMLILASWHWLSWHWLGAASHRQRAGGG